MRALASHQCVSRSIPGPGVASLVNFVLPSIQSGWKARAVEESVGVQVYIISAIYLPNSGFS